MKKVNLNIQYPKREYGAGEGKKVDSKEITLNVINYGVNNKYGISSERGMGGGVKVESMTREQRRMWSKVQDKLDENTDVIELSDEQFDFIYDVVHDFNFPAQFARAADYLDEELSKIKDEAEKKEGKKDADNN